MESMVHFRNPAVIAKDLLAVKYFWHTLAGVYFWEFVTTLDYEWSVIRGRRPYRWTIVLYSITRVATLLALIFSLFGMDSTSRYDCKVRIFQFFFGYLGAVVASLLIVLRTIAIWSRGKLVIAIAVGVWVINIGFQIQSLVRLRAAWVPALSTCAISNAYSAKPNLISMLTTDIVLLFTMLIGLLRLGFHEPGVRGLGHLMWTQGLVWIFFATIAYVPPVVLTSLDLNDSFNHMFQLSAVITTAIATTRLYRSLVDFSSKTTEIEFVTDRLRPIAFTTSKVNQVPAQPILVETFEAAVHETYEQHQTPRNSQYSSSISREGSLRDKATGLGLDYDMERGAESGT